MIILQTLPRTPSFRDMVVWMAPGFAVCLTLTFALRFTRLSPPARVALAQAPMYFIWIVRPFPGGRAAARSRWGRLRFALALSAIAGAVLYAIAATSSRAH